MGTGIHSPLGAKCDVIGGFWSGINLRTDTVAKVDVFDLAFVVAELVVVFVVIGFLYDFPFSKCETSSRFTAINDPIGPSVKIIIGASFHVSNVVLKNLGKTIV